MSTILYTEDAFILFYNSVYAGILPLDHKDHSAILSFHTILSRGDLLTENQGKFIVRLLKKYRELWTSIPDSVVEVIETPRWKQEFRKIDLTKEVFVEIEDAIPWICLRFPYMLKESFEKEILKDSENFLRWFVEDQYWDKEKKLRKLNLYNYNLLQINDFVQKNHFKIHESFIEAVNVVEEIWNNETQIVKKSKLVNNEVKLFNADRDTEIFFQERQKNIESDLLLSKSMGFVLDKVPKSLIEKIATSDETWFWYKDLENLIEVLLRIDGKVVFILDRSSDYKEWLQNFKSFLERKDNSIEIRVCFRLNSNEDADFNNWIKTSRFGGKVEEGKFLIFLQKPNKWLFNQLEDVKVIITNSIYPPNDQIAMYFLQSHPCVIFVGDVKPTDPKGRKIVNL